MLNPWSWDERNVTGERSHRNTPEQDRIDWILSLGREFWRGDKDADPALRIIRDGVVRVRKDQPCCGEPINSPQAHSVKRGQLAYREIAVFENRWVSAYICDSCLISAATGGGS